MWVPVQHARPGFWSLQVSKIIRARIIMMLRKTIWEHTPKAFPALAPSIPTDQWRDFPPIKTRLSNSPRGIQITADRAESEPAREPCCSWNEGRHKPFFSVWSSGCRHQILKVCSGALRAVWIFRVSLDFVDGEGRDSYFRGFGFDTHSQWVNFRGGERRENAQIHAWVRFGGGSVKLPTRASQGAFQEAEMIVFLF